MSQIHHSERFATKDLNTKDQALLGEPRLRPARPNSTTGDEIVRTAARNTLNLTIAAAANLSRRKLVLAVCLALCALALGISATAQTIITFDPPGSVLTEALAINNAGTIAGVYLDASNRAHGFVRAADGTITTFDVPGEGTLNGQGVNSAYSINPKGEITGFYTDDAYVYHGYLRARDGSFTTFDAPGAGTGEGQGTLALDINPAGVIAGQYSDSSSVYHGFVRARDGTITTFDAPGAGTSPGQGTLLSTVDGLNPEGTISRGYVNEGSLFDNTQVFHSLVRDRDGNITEFDVTGAGTGPGQGTDVAGINPSGTVEGSYIDGSGVVHGFVRSPNGAITKSDVAGAGTGSGQGTFPFPANINPSAVIAGGYVDTGGAAHGFVRTRNGAITKFDVPGAGTGPGQGTFSNCNNAAGATTGWYVDTSNVFHGFLREP